MVEETTILGDYPVEEVSTIKYLKQLAELPSRYENDAPAGTTKRFKSLDRRFSDAAILCKRAVKVGSQVAKVHILSDATFGRECLRGELAEVEGLGLAEVAATHSLLLNKPGVDQMFSSTVAINEDPPTGIKLNLDLPYILDGLAEKIQFSS